VALGEEGHLGIKDDRARPQPKVGGGGVDITPPRARNETYDSDAIPSIPCASNLSVHVVMFFYASGLPSRHNSLHARTLYLS